MGLDDDTETGFSEANYEKTQKMGWRTEKIWSIERVDAMFVLVIIWQKRKFNHKNRDTSVGILTS